MPCPLQMRTGQSARMAQHSDGQHERSIDEAQRLCVGCAQHRLCTQRQVDLYLVTTYTLKRHITCRVTYLNAAPLLAALLPVHCRGSLGHVESKQTPSLQPNRRAAALFPPKHTKTPAFCRFLPSLFRPSTHYPLFFLLFSRSSLTLFCHSPLFFCPGQRMRTTNGA